MTPEQQTHRATLVFLLFLFLAVLACLMGVRQQRMPQRVTAPRRK